MKNEFDCRKVTEIFYKTFILTQQLDNNIEIWNCFSTVQPYQDLITQTYVAVYEGFTHL